jgi:hypothetical protein
MTSPPYLSTIPFVLSERRLRQWAEEVRLGQGFPSGPFVLLMDRKRFADALLKHQTAVKKLNLNKEGLPARGLLAIIPKSDADQENLSSAL